MVPTGTFWISSVSVSVLFSEPKIPQSSHRLRPQTTQVPVSVLFSEPKIPQFLPLRATSSPDRFQCSSASRKFLNPATCRGAKTTEVCFSALQRAENSSMERLLIALVSKARFSALQRAENSSIRNVPSGRTVGAPGFQCSSASRKFLNKSALCAGTRIFRVSVLFSEPKIPQSRRWWRGWCERRLFQCSSASRKFLNSIRAVCPTASRI